MIQNVEELGTELSCEPFLLKHAVATSVNDFCQFFRSECGEGRLRAKLDTQLAVEYDTDRMLTERTF